MTPEELDRLYYKTSFCGIKNPEWKPKYPNYLTDTDNLVKECVPECVYLGSSNIILSTKSERSDEDCLFIETLIRKYRSGELLDSKTISNFTTYGSSNACCELCGSPTCRGGCFK